MKKTLVVAFVLMLAFSALAFGGPLIGMQLVPATGSAIGFVVGWSLDYMQFEAAKADLASWNGTYTLAALWTPSTDWGSYRAGVRLSLDWSGTLIYNGLGFVVGAQKQLFPAGVVYGELDLSSTGTLTPLLGFNFVFDLLPAGGGGDEGI